MNNWLQPLKELLELESDFVILTVIETKGSTPCSDGEKIIYAGHNSTYGSIGGGNLEYQALHYAEELLNQSELNTNLIKYPLGATLGQCCGGYVRVMFERISSQGLDQENTNNWLENIANLIEQKQDFVTATLISSTTDQYYVGDKIIYTSNNTKNSKLNDLNDKILDISKTLFESHESTSMAEISSPKEGMIEVCFEKHTFSDIQVVAVFGAGHIAQAMMPILVNLPITIYWIDDRPLQFENYTGDTTQINIICDNFVDIASELPKNSYCLVITYSHQLDFEVCEKIISCNSFSYLGMIGSTIKGNKFRERLRQKGWSNETVDRLICPIGEKHKFLKSPSAISIPIAMDLLNFLESKKQKATQ